MLHNSLISLSCIKFRGEQKHSLSHVFKKKKVLKISLTIWRNSPRQTLPPAQPPGAELNLHKSVQTDREGKKKGNYIISGLMQSSCIYYSMSKKADMVSFLLLHTGPLKCLIRTSVWGVSWLMLVFVVSCFFVGQPSLHNIPQTAWVMWFLWRSGHLATFSPWDSHLMELLVEN